MFNHPFVSKRAPYYADVPDEKWNNWRWQLSNRINTPEEFEKVIPLTDSERKALSAAHLFRVDITPYFASLIDPDDPNDPIRRQVVPTDRVAERAEELAQLIARMPADGLVIAKEAFRLVEQTQAYQGEESASVLFHAFATNLRFEKDEFNFVRERSRSDATSTFKQRDAHFSGDES